jgi:xanthine dehydrogenase small subunit
VQKHEEISQTENAYLFDQPGLNTSRQEGNTWILCPSVTVTDLKNSPVINQAFPEFQRFAKLVSSTPIRNMATIAGNFVNASPIGDFTIFFLALDAGIRLSSGRELPLRNFYKGYKQLDKGPGELITEISFTLPEAADFINFEKVSKRTHLDIASVNTAIHLKINRSVIEKAGLAAGGVGPVPLYLKKTSSWLAGKEISEETIAGAIELINTEISPISDVRGSREYKTILLGQLIKAHFSRLEKMEEVCQ